MNRQISRTALLYFLAVFSACVLFLAVFLPWWLIPFSGVCLLWRYLVFVGRTSFPSVWIKTSLVFLSGAALFLQFGFSISLDVFITLLLLGFSLKLLEIYHCNDAMMLLYLSFFVMMTVFLYEHSFLYVFLVFLVSLLILSSMIAIQSADGELRKIWSQPLRKAVLVSVLALPVMLFLFVVMPRLPPLWSMPLQKQQQARTGMSDSMSPGDISSLAKSAELAFRVTFEREVPKRRDLYWYGKILDHFDGVRWTDSCAECVVQKPVARSFSGELNSAIPYQVILEPHGSRWAYTLLPSTVSDKELQLGADGIASYVTDVVERQSYAALYYPREKAAQSDLQDKSRFLELPERGNLRSREMAYAWKRDASDEKAIVDKALEFYRSEFFYTLQPPALSEQRIDDFLFRTRSGFCEHYASSFVFLMRAAGIPARVAVGYMGGEINANERYVTVRQYDAHAWAEVWLADSGWVRVDPTAAVSPERIDLGFWGAYSNDSSFAGNSGFSGLQKIPLLNLFRLELDRFDYLWSRWVLGYQSEQQQYLLQRMGLLSPFRIAILAAGGVALVFILLCVYLYWREWWSTQEHRATIRYRQLCHAYMLLGIERMPADTPLQYAENVRIANLPGADRFSALSHQYYEWLYLCSADQKPDPSPDFMSLAKKLYWDLLLQAIKVRIFDRS